MDLRDKNILILGLGLSGKSALRWAIRCGAHTFAVDRHPPRDDDPSPDHFYLEQEGLWRKILPSLNVVVLSPGIPQDHPLILEAKNFPLEIMSEVELAYRFLGKEKIIAVTGTSGKSTTATMVRELLTIANRSVFFGGNIGVPLCDYLLEKPPREFVVLELSSFQLESIHHFTPHIGLFLNASFHHGERYQCEKDYIKAKARLGLNMGPDDTLIYPNDPKIMALFENHCCKKILLDPSAPPPFPREKVSIPGRHNLINFSFVLEVARALDIPSGDFLQLLKDFSGVPHRFEDLGPCPLAERAINDSKSTSFMACEAALHSLEESWGDITLILGGALRGRNDSPLPSFVSLLHRSCGEIILQGNSANLLAHSLKGLPIHLCRDLTEALNHLAKGQKRRLVLFSPAYPSYDQFDHYIARGEAFKKRMTES